MDPATVDAVLRYLYSGETKVDGEIEHRLEAYAQLYIHADFFKLDQLRKCAGGHIFDALRSSARLTWCREAYKRANKSDEFSAYLREIGEVPDLDSFGTDLSEAIKLMYTLPTARALQQLLTACAFAMGTDFSKDRLTTLFTIPAFKADMMAVLVDSRFNVDFPMLSVVEFDKRSRGDRCMCCYETLPRVGFMAGEGKWCHYCSDPLMDHWLREVVPGIHLHITK